MPADLEGDVVDIDTEEATSDGYQGMIVLVWPNQEPRPSGVDLVVQTDIRRSHWGLEKPSDLMLHQVTLTDDLNGPCVCVTGREGSSAFICRYREKAE